MTDIGNRKQAAGDGPNVDELLQDLSRMLEVTPSPAFGARVLAGVRRPTRESLLWSWRWGFAAGALVTVVLLTVMTYMNSKALITRPSDASARQTAAAPAIDPVPPTPPAAAPGVRQSEIHGELRPTAASAVRRAPRMPQVLIAPDQAAAVHTLLVRFARGNVPSTVVSKDTAEAALQELAIDELAPIPLIVISPLDAPPNAGGAGSKK